jgi:hypothetical protein
VDLQLYLRVLWRFRILVGATVDAPMAEFERAASAACGAAAAQAGQDPATIAAAVAGSMPEGPDLAHWRATALAVSAQYLFLGGCDVEDPVAVLDALNPHVTEELTGGG